MPKPHYFVSVLISSAFLLPAHDFYLLPKTFQLVSGGTIEVAFNNGDSFPISEAAPSLARLKDAQLQFANGTIAISGLKTQGKRVVGSMTVPAFRGDFLISARTAPNFIQLPADKFLAYLKEEGLREIINWRSQHGESEKVGRERYSKFAKSLLQSQISDGFYRHVAGFPLEILMQANPSSVHAGSQLPVQIIFEGKPVADQQLEASWMTDGKSNRTIVGRTDANGRILIPLRAAGPWRLHSLRMQRCTEPAVADWESFWTSLTFEIQ